MTVAMANSKWREQSAMVAGAFDIKDMTERAKQAMDVRDKARVSIAVRSGLVIWKGQRVDSIVGFYKECAKAHTHIPKRLRTQLDKLKEESEQAGQEQPEPDEDEEGGEDADGDGIVGEEDEA